MQNTIQASSQKYNSSNLVHPNTQSDSFPNPSINSSPNLSNVITTSSKVKAASKFFCNADSVSQLQDNKLLLVQMLKASLKKSPIMTYTQKIGIFQGFSGYSYKNGKKANEDRLDININYKRNNKEISFFGIYDGHGGDYVANYLKDNLHKELIKDEDLVQNPKKAILNIYEKIENNLLMSGLQLKNHLSGSCALLLMIIDDIITIINIGDSRSILSNNSAENIYSISIDHKPENETEKNRIMSNGGVIQSVKSISRVFPGGLSVSRSIGDAEFKVSQLGGKPNIIAGVPDIFSFKYKKEMDFILLGSDGIYELMSNKDIVLLIYMTLRQSVCKKESRTYEKTLEKIVYKLEKKVILKGVKDNLTTVFLPFENFKRLYDNECLGEIDKILTSIKMTDATGERLYEDILDSYMYRFTLGNILSLPSGGFEFKQKSTLVHQNIRFYENSFTKSNISLDGKRNESQMPPIDDNETSDTSKSNVKTKKSKPLLQCCGIFV